MKKETVTLIVVAVLAATALGIVYFITKPKPAPAPQSSGGSSNPLNQLLSTAGGLISLVGL